MTKKEFTCRTCMYKHIHNPELLTIKLKDFCEYHNKHVNPTDYCSNYKAIKYTYADYKSSLKKFINDQKGDV